jgi:hypothetical protein
MYGFPRDELVNFPSHIKIHEVEHPLDADPYSTIFVHENALEAFGQQSLGADFGTNAIAYLSSDEVSPGLLKMCSGSIRMNDQRALMELFGCDRYLSAMEMATQQRMLYPEAMLVDQLVNGYITKYEYFDIAFPGDLGAHVPNCSGCEDEFLNARKIRAEEVWRRFCPSLAYLQDYYEGLHKNVSDSGWIPHHIERCSSCRRELRKMALAWQQHFLDEAATLIADASFQKAGVLTGRYVSVKHGYGRAGEAGLALWLQFDPHILPDVGQAEWVMSAHPQLIRPGRAPEHFSHKGKGRFILTGVSQKAHKVRLLIR